MNITKDDPIVYDPEIINKIKKMIQEGFEKLETFVKIKKQYKFNIYFELDEKFNEIALKLEKYDFLNNELNYFLSISDKILYIIYQNCEDYSFGHCNFALDLFDLFMDIWNAKLYLINNFSKNELENYFKLENTLKKKYGAYRHKFYLKIYKSKNEFTEREIYEFHKSLRE